MIEREPEVPILKPKDISFLTETVFGIKAEVEVCDLAFIFSSTHPGHWGKAVEAYRNGLVQQFLVTG